MAFWLDKGPADAALSWTRLEPKIRQSYLDAFHSSGKRVLVSAFGETDHPTMNDVDPVECAQRLAEFVIEYGFDGADIDYEDNRAMHLGKAEDWVISIMKTLRLHLPSPQFIISHAPQPPMFTKNKEFYPKGGYTTIHKNVGHLIDFYNVQFYNQGATTKYETCQTLLFDSGTHTPGTALFQIAEMGVPLEKLVVGKPMHPNGTTSSGYMDSRYLATCIEQAKKYGWAAGIMGELVIYYLFLFPKSNTSITCQKKRMEL
ncbi:glycoside hydrolase [Obelidium mucronatum]|nr:glycoside hydrolase [Obelidium mucronatum]